MSYSKCFWVLCWIDNNGVLCVDARPQTEEQIQRRVDGLRLAPIIAWASRSEFWKRQNLWRNENGFYKYDQHGV